MRRQDYERKGLPKPVVGRQDFRLVEGVWESVIGMSEPYGAAVLVATPIGRVGFRFDSQEKLDAFIERLIAMRNTKWPNK